MRRYIALLLILAPLEISLALFLTFWRENFWQAVSLKQGTAFLTQLEIFTAVALCICFIAGVSGYYVSLATIKWREKLNAKAFAIQELQIDVENIAQRIQDDCMSYPDLVLNLVFGSLKAVLYIIVFSISLIMDFHWQYLLILCGYMVLGSLLTKYIASPLITLNYQQQRAEATYRTTLSLSNFHECIRIMLGLAKRQKQLTYFQQFYGQLGVVLPLILVAPVYFTSGMTLGMLMRFNSVGSTLLENMSFGVNNFASINKLLSCRKRLKEIGVI